VVLLYCAAGQVLDALPSGVAGAVLRTFEAEGVSFCFSQHESLQLSDAAALKQHALAFHHGLQVLLSATDIVPFRFPTAFESQEAAQSALAPRAGEYAAALESIRGSVQLEAAIAAETLRPQGVISGKQFMEMKAAAAQRESAIAAKALAIAGVVRAEVKAAPGGARLYLLVRRENVNSVRAEVSGLLQQTLSGPWPAAHFIRIGPQAGV
jgi:hypothetical protein